MTEIHLLILSRQLYWGYSIWSWLVYLINIYRILIMELYGKESTGRDKKHSCNGTIKNYHCPSLLLSLKYTLRKQTKHKCMEKWKCSLWYSGIWCHVWPFRWVRWWWRHYVPPKTRHHRYVDCTSTYKCVTTLNICDFDGHHG